MALALFMNYYQDCALILFSFVFAADFDILMVLTPLYTYMLCYFNFYFDFSFRHDIVDHPVWTCSHFIWTSTHGILLCTAVILFLGACMKPPHLSLVTEYMEMSSLYNLIHSRAQRSKLHWRRRLKMLRDICRWAILSNSCSFSDCSLADNLFAFLLPCIIPWSDFCCKGVSCACTGWR